MIDTSVAVALVVEDHEHHATTIEAVGDRQLGLAGHAAFETYSVLTRLPAPVRRSPEAAERLLRENFPLSRHLTRSAADGIMRKLADLGIAGGSVYDGLVAAVAAESQLVLLTRDVRAVPTYRSLGIELEVLRD